MKRIIGIFILALACTMAPADADAQADLGFKAAGGALGYVAPEDLDGTFGLWLSADLGTIAPRFDIEGVAGFWAGSTDFFGVGTEVRDISMTARGKYMFPVSSSKIAPFVGAGLGIHFLTAEVSIPAIDLGGGLIIPATEVSDTQVKLGVDLGGGMATSLNDQLALTSDVWYSLMSDVNFFSVRVGLMYKLGM